MNSNRVAFIAGESGGGPPQSKTCRTCGRFRKRASVLDCASPLALLTIAISLATVCPAAGETPEQTAAVLAQKALTNSGAMEIVTDLTTGIGPRLAGSDAEKRAAAWAKQRFEQLGFDKVWIETFPLEHGWARGLEQAEIISPSPQPRPPNEISL